MRALRQERGDVPPSTAKLSVENGCEFVTLGTASLEEELEVPYLRARVAPLVTPD